MNDVRSTCAAKYRFVHRCVHVCVCVQCPITQKISLFPQMTRILSRIYGPACLCQRCVSDPRGLYFFGSECTPSVVSLLYRIRYSSTIHWRIRRRAQQLVYACYASCTCTCRSTRTRVALNKCYNRKVALELNINKWSTFTWTSTQLHLTSPTYEKFQTEGSYR